MIISTPHLRGRTEKGAIILFTFTQSLQSLQCSWISSLELSADRPQTASLVMQPFQTGAENVFNLESVNSPFNCTLEILHLLTLLTYLLTLYHPTFRVETRMLQRQCQCILPVVSIVENFGEYD